MTQFLCGLEFFPSMKAAPSDQKRTNVTTSNFQTGKAIGSFTVTWKSVQGNEGTKQT